MKTARQGSKMAKKAKSRTPRQSRRKSGELSRFTFYEGTSGLLSFTSFSAAVRSSKSLKAALAAVDMTMEELGQRIGRTPFFSQQRPQGFSKTYISLIDRAKKPATPRMIKAIEFVMSETLSQTAGEPIGVSLTHSSPWRFRLSKCCAKHGRYELKGNRKHCPICGK